MLKNILILLLIIILAALGAAAALKIIFWSLGFLFRIALNLAIVVVAFMGIMYLIRRMRA